jgi:hypothetical protein
MALVTGVIVRGVRAGMLGAMDTSWTSLGLYYGLTGVLYLSALTAHVGNYPLRQWAWRVPAFAVLESAAEAAASAGLIWLGREPIGASLAGWSDWSGLAWGGLQYRLAAAVVFGGILAAIVAVVRRALPEQAVEAMDMEGDRETAEFRRESLEQASPIERVLKR